MRETHCHWICIRNALRCIWKIPVFHWIGVGFRRMKNTFHSPRALFVTRTKSFGSKSVHLYVQFGTVAVAWRQRAIAAQCTYGSRKWWQSFSFILLLNAFQRGKGKRRVVDRVNNEQKAQKRAGRGKTKTEKGIRNMEEARKSKAKTFGAMPEDHLHCENASTNVCALGALWIGLICVVDCHITMHAKQIMTKMSHIRFMRANFRAYFDTFHEMGIFRCFFQDLDFQMLWQTHSHI